MKIPASRPRRAAASRALDRVRAIIDADPHLPLRIPVDCVLNDATEKLIRTQLARAWKRSSVILEIDSPGGKVASAERIVADIAGLRRMGIEVHGRVVGTCASAAVDILSASNWRTSQPHGRFCLHRSMAAIPARNCRSGDLHGLATVLENIDEALLKQFSSLALSAKERTMLREGEDIVFDAERARAIGLIHCVERGC